MDSGPAPSASRNDEREYARPLSKANTGRSLDLRTRPPDLTAAGIQRSPMFNQNCGSATAACHWWARLADAIGSNL